jgi:hypothetical protein
MRSLRRTAGLALVFFGGLASAKDHPFHVDIAPGRVGEVCMSLAEGATLRWRFTATAPLDFNLHEHVDGKVLMPVERKAVTADASERRIDQRNDWCLMWTAPAGARAATVKGVWSIAPAKP